MTAGHNALRGSDPGQKLAFEDAVALVGCPDRRIDRLCITCCSSSQPSHHAGWPARSRSRRECDRFLVAPIPGHHGPCHSCDLIGERDGGDLGRPPLFSKRISEATRLSDDPQCYWQPPRRRLPSRGVPVCRHFPFFRQVADISQPRAGDIHPNPCMPLCVSPSPDGPGR